MNTLADPEEKIVGGWGADIKRSTPEGLLASAQVPTSRIRTREMRHPGPPHLRLSPVYNSSHSQGPENLVTRNIATEYSRRELMQQFFRGWNAHLSYGLVLASFLLAASAVAAEDDCDRL